MNHIRCDLMLVPGYLWFASPHNDKNPGEGATSRGTVRLVEESNAMKTNCLHPGCEGKNWLAGLCGPHHAQAKVWTQVEETSDGCWLWLGPLNSKGYGRIGNRYAHRISYERAVGPIPTGMMIDHICHVLRCVNPEHLRLVTNKQNEENRAGAQRNSRSGVRGVWWNTRDRLWQVQVKHFGRRYNGGTYRELVDAEAAAVELRNRLHTHNDLDRTA